MSGLQLNASKEPKSKLHYLDGMRGFMAINVILCHFCCVFYPQMYFENAAREASGFLSLFATTPLSALVNGNIAVMYFMVLTGFLVGMSTFTKDVHGVRVFAIKSVNRYTRLLPVVFVATLATYALMKFNLLKHLSVTDTMVNTKYLQDFCNFEPNIKSLVLNIFVKPFLRESDYIGPFWTIKLEFLGYILTLFLAMTFKKKPYRRLVYIGAAAFIAVLAAINFPFANMHFIAFVMGLYVADLKYNTNPTVFSKFDTGFSKTKLCLILCYVAGIYFSCCTMFSTPLYSWWYAIPVVHKSLLRGLGMAMLIFAFTNTPAIQKVLSWKPLLKLGEASFEIYALHWPIMLSLEVALFMMLRKTMPYDASAVLSFVITTPVIMVVSFLAHYLIEQYNKLLNKVKSRKNKA